MTNVPAEYLGTDYGFSAVDEPDFAKPTQVEQSTLNIDLDDRFDSMDEKLDRILIEFGRMHNNVAASATEDEMREKIRQLEAIVVPLLNNLLKTADKEWIHWPNRREICQRQLDAVLKISRG
jgi:regulator of PEP synthase PpsR (kinase-PPPase family)